MSAKGLARVAALYGQVERVRLVELEQASAAVAEVDRLRAIAAGEAEARKAEGRAALARGEVVAWRMAATTGEAAGQVVAKASALRQEREVVRVQAAERHLASRLLAERVARVVERLDQAEKVVDERMEQAAADDRYAARLCWARMNAG